jgi:hypothetical protein
MKIDDPRRTALVIILAHLAITIVHGISHAGADVKLSLFGKVFVLVVIILAPLVAGVLLYKVSLSAGGWLMTLSMAGSLCFGVLYHFLLAGADNVMQVHGSWHLLFVYSAFAVAVVELIGTLWGFRLIQLASNTGSRTHTR